jgi:hypothetical protein
MAQPTRRTCSAPSSSCPGRRLLTYGAVDVGPASASTSPQQADLAHQRLHRWVVCHGWISSILCPELIDGHEEAQRQERDSLHCRELRLDLLHHVPLSLATVAAMGNHSDRNEVVVVSLTLVGCSCGKRHHVAPRGCR